jgi:hypothetical protein
MWAWVLDLRPHDIIADDWDIDNWDPEDNKEK